MEYKMAYSEEKKHAVLSRDLRSKLESTIIAARKRAEAAALDELKRLGVDAGIIPAYLDPEDRELRRRLRVRGRHLGDSLLEKDAQEIERLALEIAYEHWHRMLFARFLAENRLLIHPEYKVALSLEECDELAREEEKAGRVGTTRWDIAAGFASNMLPQIFRKDSPALAISFPSNERAELERLLAALPREVFLADDSLGWVYQFWQSEAKEAVNKSEKKIGANELPSVTQLFTEDYMVSFLLDNSLGAWWAGKRLSKEDLAGAPDEESLRKKLSLPELPFSYLRFVKQEERWKPASGCFEAWPKNTKELKYLDPCCGSGHFLTAGFHYLVAMRQAEEGLDTKAAGDAVLRDNLFGLELDPRCVEIAAFSLAFQAWRSGGGYRELPELHVACSGAAPQTSKAEWLSVADRVAGTIAGDESDLFPDPNKASLWKSELHDGMAALYDLFKDAPVLGSLIDPRSVTSTLFRAGFDKTADLLAEALKKEPSVDESHETGVIAQGIAKAASILADQYHVIATNVPYLKGGDHAPILKQYCESNYPLSKYDLATVFIERCHKMLANDGAGAFVTQQYWLFLKYYETYRRQELESNRYRMIARLGPAAFETIGGEVVNVCLQISQKGKPESDFSQSGIELDPHTCLLNKISLLSRQDVLIVKQKNQLNNPDARISFELSGERTNLLSALADFGKGSVTGDGPHYLRFFWEINGTQKGYERWLNSPKLGSSWTGREYYALWKVPGHNPSVEEGFRFHGQRVFGHKGVAVGKAGQLRFTPYLGELFDDNVAVICPRSGDDLVPIWQYCTSGLFESNIRLLDKKMSVTAGTFTKVPFELMAWSSGNTAIPDPYSDDPTQWIFHGHPAGSLVWDETEKRLIFGKLRTDLTVLQVAVARLIGYHWPAELDPNMELSTESRALIESCKLFDHFVDEDGILCIPSVNREQPATERLLEILATAYGKEWTSHSLSELLAASNWADKDLESWLRDAFFEQHCKLFQHRPFIWQITDGLKDGFSVLVNYHRLNHSLLEKLIYSYLGDWIFRQEADERAKKPGATVRVNAAKALKEKLELILEGEAPYDIFVRWKSLAEQPIGWNPDLNDGVRLNIRPFMTASVLRHNKPPKLNVKWEKDRGKDVESAPWFKVFAGDRINDHHTSLEEKRKARSGK